MSEQEYIVSLNRDVDFTAFNQEMISLTGAGFIPNRTVEIANARPGSQRNTHYFLTTQEVDILKQDNRVYGVELRPDLRDDIQIGLTATQSVVSGTMPSNHYTDYDGHGTHVAGIAAGKTYGWGKNSRIYAVKVAGLEGTADPGTGIPISDCFDVIKEWHKAKPIDPTTGVKRPTVVIQAHIL